MRAITGFEQRAIERAVQKLRAGRTVLGRSAGIGKYRWKKLKKIAIEIAERGH